MKIRLPLFALICALASLPGLRAEDAAAPKQMPDKDDQTELGSKMEKIGGAFRRLRKVDPATKLAQVADPAKNEDSLKQVAIIKENAIAASKLEPALKKDKPADQQEKFMTDYQAKMKSFLDDIDKLEAALKAGQNDEAAKLVNTLNTDQKEGHTDFRKKEKKKM